MQGIDCGVDSTYKMKFHHDVIFSQIGWMCRFPFNLALWTIFIPFYFSFIIASKKVPENIILETLLDELHRIVDILFTWKMTESNWQWHWKSLATRDHKESKNLFPKAF